MIRFIAIDPGDVWCGYAMLEYDPEGLAERYFLTEARVFHVPSRKTLLETTHDILFGLPAIVIAEDYAVRPVHFNRFSKGKTLRLLGALELATNQSLASSFNLVPPGDWEKDLPKLCGSMMKTWSKDWLVPKRKDWGHAKSAWRVMFMYLMKHYPDVAMTLRHDDCVRSYKRIRSVLYSTERRTHPLDLAASAGKWFVPQHARKSLRWLGIDGRT